MNIHTLRQISAEVLREKKPDYKLDPRMFGILLDFAQIKHMKRKIGLPEEYQPGMPIPSQVMGISRKVVHDLAPFLVTFADEQYMDELIREFLPKYGIDNTITGFTHPSNTNGLLKIEFESSVTWAKVGDTIQIRNATGIHFPKNGTYSVATVSGNTILTNALSPAPGTANGDSPGVARKVERQIILALFGNSTQYPVGTNVSVVNATGAFASFNNSYRVVGLDVDGLITLNSDYPPGFTSSEGAVQSSSGSLRKAIPGQEVIPLNASGEILLPQNYFMLSSLSIAYEDGGVISKCKFVTDDEWADLETSSFPVTTKEGIVTMYGNKLKVLPANAGYIRLNYYRRPVAPIYSVTSTNNYNEYNPATSVNLEWDDTNQIDILYIMLSDLGIVIEREDIFQTSEKVKERGI